ncbi:MAG: hypothetical protein AB1393_08980 [Candidatus Edwardsbacteria bacterium]
MDAETLKEELLKLHEETDENQRQDSPYFIDNSGYLCRWKQLKDGVIPVRLANFEAQISEEITEDDGFELTHSYGIEGRIKNKFLPKIEVPASFFNSLNWLHKWGSQVILEPGQANKDYVRHAIQVRSNGARNLTYFTHTGWRQIQGGWCYLTGGGAIGRDAVSVKLSKELQRYYLPLKPENETESIKISLSFLDIGKRAVTIPLFSLLHLSPLTTILEPMPNFSGYIYGETGLFKTTLAILLLSHFGSFDSINNLSNFDDTANALEKRAFILKDTLHIIDDFCPSIKRIDVQHKENLAQRIIRAYSNRTARGRLNPDASEKGRYEPRGMLLMTGEEIVSLQSTLARLMVAEISAGDIDKDRLTEFQMKAHLLPHAMSSYISWLKDHIQEIKKSFPKQFIQLRDKAFKEDTHRKLPEQVAFLQFALDTVISWMVDKGILVENEALTLSKEGWDIFIELSNKQSERLEKEDPVRRFEEIIQTLITQGKVKIEDKDIPDSKRVIGGLQGELIGYYDDFYLYFLPPALWHSLQRYCIAEGSHFPFYKNTFYRMLANRKLIEVKDGRHVISEWIRGKTQRVLKFIDRGICGNEAREVRNDSEA